MHIWKFKAALVVVIISAIILINSGLSLLMEQYIIHNSGTIGAPTIQTSEYTSEMRAVFFKAQSMTVPPDWDAVMNTLNSYGINAIIAETTFTVWAHYPSQYVPYGEVILPDALTAAHARGIKFYAHLNTLLGTHDSTHAVVTASGSQGGFSCPAKQVVRTLWKNLVEELLTSYPNIDGIVLDYARYEGTDNCYCTECKAAFAEYLGETITSWPGPFAPGGARYNEFIEWRSHPINDLVRDIAAWAKAIKPNVEIVASVWGVYDPSQPEVWKYYLGQDWFYWVKEGYVDWVFGMAYTTSTDVVSNCVLSAHQYGTGGPQGKVPYMSFLADGPEGEGTSNPTLFNQLVEASRNAGAEGFGIFSYGGPGEFVGYATDIRPILNAINLYPTFSIRNINVSPASNTCTITWETDLPASSKVEYSTSPLFTATSKPSQNYQDIYYWDIDHVPGTLVEDATAVTDHGITLTGLLPGTRYYFRVQSQDANGIATSKVDTFTTT